MKLLRWMLAALLALLVYQGKQIENRIDRLEKNTTRIMVKLGIEPVARGDTLESGVKNAGF